MLKFVAVDKNFFESGLVYLTDTQSVEKEFISVLNWHKEAFRDAKSLKLMSDIDSAKRQGDYGVITPYGESCISCLSTGCKFGLLMIFYEKMENVKILVKLSAAGENVWNWLADNVDRQVYVGSENLWGISYIDNMELIYDGLVYANDDKKLMDVVVKCDRLPYQMTPELEEKAYDRYKRFQGKENIQCFPQEKLDIASFIKRFPEAEYYLNDEYDGGDYADYQVINYCATLPKEFTFRRQPMYICGKNAQGMKFDSTCSVKWPKFLELMIFDVLDGNWWYYEEGRQEHCWLGKVFDSWFVLILDGDEQCEVEEYPKQALFGMEVEPDKKCITIYDKEQSIEKFHLLYAKCDREYVGG